MNHKEYIYFLTDTEGRSYVVEGGQVKKQALPQHLENSPDGWKDVLIGFERDFETSGLVTTFSFPLSFLGDGRKIICDAVYNKNVAEDLVLLIKRFKQTVENGKYYPLHRYFYKAPIDLSSFEDDTAKGKTTVTLEDRSLAGKIKSGGNTKQEIDLDTEPETILVKMEGIEFTRTSNFIIPESEYTGLPFAPLTFVNNEGLSGVVTATSQDTELADQYFLKNVGGQTITIKMEGTVGFTAVNSRIQEVHFILSRRGTGVDQPVKENLFKPVPEGATYSVVYNETITLQPQQELFLLIRVITAVGDQQNRGRIKFDLSRIKATYITRYADSYVQALKPLTTLQRLTQKTAGAEVGVRSALLTQNENLVITSGDAIRGLAGAKIKTSFNEFFEAFKVVLDAGVGAEGNEVVLEKRSYFYNTANPINLGIVKNLKVKYASDLPGNTLKIGYDVQAIDDVNGKYESNNSLTFKTPYAEKEKELSFICPYITQPYYIETIRINLDGKTTTDNTADNSVFILNVEGEPIQFSATLSFEAIFGVPGMIVKGADAFSDRIVKGMKITIAGTALNNGVFTVTGTAPFGTIGFLVFFKEGVEFELDAPGTVTTAIYSLKKGMYDSVAGIPSPDTIFNIEQLTPKRVLMTNLKFINSLFHGFGGQKLTFQTTEKNDALKTVQGSLVIEEKADVELTEDKYFQPFYLEFEPLAPVEMATMLEENPNSPFVIETEEGHQFLGFLKSSGLAPSTRQEQTFKLLSGPQNDLSKLI